MQDPPRVTDEEGAKAPDPEVSEAVRRRRFSGSYKLRVLREADACSSTKGGLGALLRRESLYSSHLTSWRRQRERGELDALQPRRRGRPPTDPATTELARLRRENERLAQRLATAETIIEIQKKVAGLLECTLPSASEQP
jgi:transposase-like protein